MKVVYLKTAKIHIPFNYTAEIKNNGKLEYWIRGIGRKQTQAFDILDEEIPDRGSELSWFEICELVDKYGIYVGDYYADSKVAGIISMQTIKGYYSIYEKIKDHLPEDFDPKFFDMMKCVYIFSCFGLFTLDIVSLDDRLAEADPEYDNKACTYKGKKISMKQYINQKYGLDYVKLIELCTESEDEDKEEVFFDPDQLSLDV